VPADIVARDVVLGALWHQHLTAVLLGYGADTPIRHTRLGKASGLRAHDYRGALHELIAMGLVTPAGVNSYALTRAGHREAAQLLDTEHILALAQEGRVGPETAAA